MKTKIFLTGLIMIFILTGCFTNESKNENKSIKIWYAWTGNEEQELVSSIKSYANDIGVSVELTRVSFSELQKSYIDSTKKGIGPDLIIGPNDYIGIFKTYGYIEELNGYLPDSLESEFIKTAWDSCKNENKLYALPESIKVAAMYYNKDIINKLPQNTDEMIQVSRELINSKKITYGLVYDFQNYYYHTGWVEGFGESVLDKNYNPTFNSTGQINAVKFVNSLYVGQMQ